MQNTAKAAHPTSRLISLDAFRGLVIVMMLIVNNIGDDSRVSYFFKHADWINGSQADAFRVWWSQLCAAGFSAFADFPLLHHCTLADFVMPWFMLIIGIALPFSRFARAPVSSASWWRALRRAAGLVVLGWIIDASLTLLAWHRAGGGGTPTILLGLDVLQLLGVASFAAFTLYRMPARRRAIAAALLFAAHWALLRFWPQTGFPAGTFTEAHNAASEIYRTWALFRTRTLLAHLQFSLVGLLSVTPATATMLVGTLIGDWIKRPDVKEPLKTRHLALAGTVLAVLGFLWAFDLPFNKPRWSPAYLVYCSGVGAVVIAGLHRIIDVRGLRAWASPLVVFGRNPLGVYVLSILLKVWFIYWWGFDSIALHGLQVAFGPTAGSWAFTACFVGFWWALCEIADRRGLYWRL